MPPSPRWKRNTKACGWWNLAGKAIRRSSRAGRHGNLLSDIEVQPMRRAMCFLMLFALTGPVAAQLEFLSVDEIFTAISFLAAHPESPADYRTVSPLGPDLSETRMPETFDDLAQALLRCYHRTARYQRA